MNKKILAMSVISFFVFILFTTAWDYCHPDPDHPLIKNEALSDHSPQIKKPHHPCASLKDAYDFLSSFRIFQPSVGYGVDIPVFASIHFSFEADSLKQNGLSPPTEGPPPSLPLFQLNCNLRI